MPVFGCSHPGTPTIFYDHLFHDQHLRHAVARLVEQRKAAGIHCRRQAAEGTLLHGASCCCLLANGPLRPHTTPSPASAVTILAADRDVYAAEVEGEGGALLVKIGPGDWKPSQGGWKAGEGGQGPCRLG